MNVKERKKKREKRKKQMNENRINVRMRKKVPVIQKELKKGKRKKREVESWAQSARETFMPGTSQLSNLYCKY